MIPAGWKLVPEVATPEMRRALFVNLTNADDEAYVIAQVLEAAPAPPPGWRGMDDVSIPKDGERFFALDLDDKKPCLLYWSEHDGAFIDDGYGSYAENFVWMPAPDWEEE